MSSNYDVNFNLKANDQASQALQAVFAVMRDGSAATTDQLAKFQALRDTTLLQTRALSTLRSEWNAGNASLYAFGRVMSSVGAVGTTLIGITNSLLLAQLTLAQNAANVAGASVAVTDAQNKYNQAVLTFGVNSQQALQALSDLHTAETNQITTDAQAARSNFALQLQYIAIGLSVGSMVASVVTAASQFSAFAGTMGTTGGALAGVIGAFVAGITAAVGLGAGFAALAGIMVDIATKGMSVGQAIQSVVSSMNAIPVAGPIFGAIAEGVGEIFESFYDLGQVTRSAFTDLFNAADAFGGDVKGALKATWATIATDAQGAWNTISNAWTVLWTGIEAFIGPIWTDIQGVVKAGINGIIDILDGLIAGWNAIINAVNSATKFIGVTLPSIPTIPHLATGAIVNGPTVAMIGEHVPEAVTPLGPGGPTGAGGGLGGNTTIIIQASGSIFSENDLQQFVDQALQARYSLRRRTS